MPDPDATPLPLHAWLRAATDGLCDEAKVFLYSSIEAHFAGEVEAALGDGKERAAAEAAALAAMGDADTANAQLRRAFLTPLEARRFKMILKGLRAPIRWWPIMFGTLLCAGIAYFYLSVHNSRFLLEPLTSLLLGGGAFLGVVTLRRYLARLWPERRSLHFVLIARDALDLTVCVGAIFFLCSSFHEFSDWFGFWFQFLIVFLIPTQYSKPEHGIRVWFAVLAKLGRNPRLAEDFEPPPTPVAPMLKGLADHA